jgi:hypothetical protein
MKRKSAFPRFFRNPFFIAVFLFMGDLLPVFAQSANKSEFDLVLGKLSFFLYTNVLKNGSQTDFSLGYQYTPLTEGELRLSYIKESYNDTMYDLEESLMANDEQTFEIFLLPFRYNFFSDALLNFNAAAGVYYEYNMLKQHGYFNHPAFAPDSLNIYLNSFSMHLFGPLVEASTSLEIQAIDIELSVGIVPVFYLRRDQSVKMKPFMGTGFFDYSQNTGGSPYFYGELSGMFFKFLSVSLLYEHACIDYGAIAYDAGRNWAILEEELVSRSFKIEAAVLLPLGENFFVRLGYGHSFDTLELNSSTPVQDNKHYFIIGSKK